MSKLDLIGLLDKVDENAEGFYGELDDLERKDFAPIVVLRWLSSSRDPNQLLPLNDYANRVVFHHYKHPELMYKLFVACTPGKKHYYKWLPRKKKPKLSKKVDVVSRYLKCSHRRATEHLRVLTKDDILEMSTELGDPSSFLTDLKAEFK